MAQDIWFEGGPGLLRLTDSGTFTLNNAKTAPFNADRSIHGGNQALTLDGFRGQVSLLNHHFTETALQVYGDGSSTDLLLLGCGGFPFPTVPPLPQCINNLSPEARAEYWFSSANGLQTPHATEPDPAFLLKMLEQVRTETPRRLVPLPSGVTDVRLYRVSVEACKYGMILSGLNAPPELAALPTQYGHEGSPLFITNVVTGPDAPYNLCAFTLGADPPLGLTIHPDTGVIQWTPTEAQRPGVCPITIRVTDNGQPPLILSWFCWFPPGRKLRGKIVSDPGGIMDDSCPGFLAAIALEDGFNSDPRFPPLGNVPVRTSGTTPATTPGSGKSS